MMAVGELSPDVKRAFAAPFPDERFMAGPRRFPGLVPIFPDDPAIPDNRRAWDVLRRFDKPLLTSWSDDPGVGPPDRLQQEIPGARDQSHVRVGRAPLHERQSSSMRGARACITLGGRALRLRESSVP